MKVAEVSQEKNIPTYVHGLLMTKSRKTCTQIARATCQSHDSIYRSFGKSEELVEDIRKDLVDLAKSTIFGDKKYLILDDSQLSKPHASEIEGLSTGFDGSSGRLEPGLQMVTALLTDGTVRMPLNVVSYLSRRIAGAYFKTKSEIATQITSTVREVFKISMILADAHYSTKTFLSFLNAIGQNFLMKFTRNRIVTIGQKSG